MIEYQVIEASDTGALSTSVEQAVNKNYWELCGGVSVTYVPPLVFTNGEVRCDGGYQFCQALVRSEARKLKALKEQGWA